MAHLRTSEPSPQLYAADYSYAVTAPAGSVIFTAGACPLDASGVTVAPGDVVAQTRQCMANLRVALAQAGARLDDVAKVTVYVAETLQVDLTVAWDEVKAEFGDHKPAATLLGVTVLGYDDQLVEIEAVAAIASA